MPIYPQGTKPESHHRIYAYWAGQKHYARPEDIAAANEAIAFYDQFGENTLPLMVQQLRDFTRFVCELMKNQVTHIVELGSGTSGHIDPPAGGFAIYIDDSRDVTEFNLQKRKPTDLILKANFWYPEQIKAALSTPVLAGRDFKNQPVCITLVGIVDFMSDEQLARFLAMWYSVLPVGSYLALSAITHPRELTELQPIPVPVLIEENPGLVSKAGPIMYVRPLHDTRHWADLLGKWAIRCELAPTPVESIPNITVVPGMQNITGGPFHNVGVICKKV